MNKPLFRVIHLHRHGLLSSWPQNHPRYLWPITQETLFLFPKFKSSRHQIASKTLLLKKSVVPMIGQSWWPLISVIWSCCHLCFGRGHGWCHFLCLYVQKIPSVFFSSPWLSNLVIRGFQIWHPHWRRGDGCQEAVQGYRYLEDNLSLEVVSKILYVYQM